ncbi:MAG: hypothetical protein IJF77_03570, partial [Alistipes sp.]|nr:hypothetical protein [Alistipes sp.]
VGTGLNRLNEEDPSFTLVNNAETHQLKTPFFFGRKRRFVHKSTKKSVIVIKNVYLANLFAYNKGWL